MNKKLWFCLLIMIVVVVVVVIASGETDLLTRIELLEQRVTYLESLHGIVPIDLCEGVICEDSTLQCEDNFIASCSNSCSNGICSNCTPDCTGHHYCDFTLCPNSERECDDGYISICLNECDELNNLCSVCEPSCEGHQNITYKEVTISTKISTGNDDAYELSNIVYRNDNIVVMGNNYIAGYRFKVNLPKNSVIQTATLSLAYNWGQTTNLIIYGEDIDNSNQFKTTSKDISNRVKTTSNVNWNNLKSSSWGTYSSSPDMSSIIQEIIDRDNWIENNYLTILIKSSSNIWEAVSYEGTSWDLGLYAAKLKITALVPTNSSQPPPPPPTPIGKGIVLLQMDDTSVSELSEAHEYVKRFHEEGIHITPELWSAGLSSSPYVGNALLWDSWSEVEIAQGIYSGDSPSKSYSSMVNDLQLGKAEYAAVGIIQPTSYLPHMGYPTSSGLDALRDEGFLVVIDYVSPDRVRSGDPSNPSEMPLTIHDGVDILEGSLDSYSSILSSVQSQNAEKGYADLAFHIWAMNPSNVEEIITIMKRLRDEEGYTFMTATEYFYYINT